MELDPDREELKQQVPPSFACGENPHILGIPNAKFSMHFLQRKVLKSTPVLNILLDLSLLELSVLTHTLHIFYRLSHA